LIFITSEFAIGFCGYRSPMGHEQQRTDTPNAGAEPTLEIDEPLYTPAEGVDDEMSEHREFGDTAYGSAIE